MPENKRTKIIKSVTGRETTVILEHTDGFACCGCGKPIQPGKDYFAGCNDCGGIFCEACVADGSFENHDCDDENDWD